MSLRTRMDKGDDSRLQRRVDSLERRLAQLEKVLIVSGDGTSLELKAAVKIEIKAGQIYLN